MCDAKGPSVPSSVARCVLQAKKASDALDSTEVEGRAIRIDYARPMTADRPPRKSSPPRGGGGGFDRERDRRDAPRHDRRDFPPRDRDRDRERDRGRGLLLRCLSRFVFADDCCFVQVCPRWTHGHMIGIRTIEQEDRSAEVTIDLCHRTPTLRTIALVLLPRTTVEDITVRP